MANTTMTIHNVEGIELSTKEFKKSKNRYSAFSITELQITTRKYNGAEDTVTISLFHDGDLHLPF